MGKSFLLWQTLIPNCTFILYLQSATEQPSLKRNGETSYITNKWINENKLTSFRFKWQVGYGAFSHSHSSVKRVINYIDNQEEHHSKSSFLQEYVRMLNLYEVDYKPEYLFKEV